ncbi:hypothetical protein SEA_CAMERICO_55 [Gordonia phage Camerico]|nr:hypothetical protein SEA_CAMERICO_55 [Gordonia phage Camerico]
MPERHGGKMQEAKHAAIVNQFFNPKEYNENALKNIAERKKKTKDKRRAKRKRTGR